jgi:hypothetical protein
VKIPTFHDNGELFNHVKVQVFFRHKTDPIDSKLGHGFGIQLNTSNPLVELNPDTNTWEKRGNGNLLAFQQNCLQIGHGGMIFGADNDILLWNRNSVALANGDVLYGVTALEKDIWNRVQNFGSMQQCVELDIDSLGMSIKLYDLPNGGYQAIYDAKSLPQRYSYETRQMHDTPITPWTFFQVRIVGFAENSYTTFDDDAAFGVNVYSDKNFQFNLFDSEKTFQENWSLYTIGGVENNTLYTGESSNISCNLLDNGWRGNSLYYHCGVNV